MKRVVEIADALARIHADSTLQSEICDALEGLADTLPGSLTTELASRLPAILASSWAEHVSLQEDAIFPVLQRFHAGSRDLLFQIEQLRAEHAAISGMADEIIEQLEQSLTGAVINADMLGYMLRLAFETRRQHLAAEHRLVLELLPARLAPADREILSRWLSGHSWPRSLFNASSPTH